MAHEAISEPSRKTPLFGEYEVVVLAGGPAGIAAAIAAGRSGRATLLVERYGFVGGAGLSTFCGLHAVVNGIVDDVVERLAPMDGLNKPHLTIRDQILVQAYDISAFKIAVDELMAEAKVTVLFHAFGVVMPRT